MRAHELRVIRETREVPRNNEHVYAKAPKIAGVDTAAGDRFCPRDANIGARVRKGQRLLTQELQRQRRLGLRGVVESREAMYNEEADEEVDARYIFFKSSITGTD